MTEELITIENYNLAHLFDPDQRELVEKFIKDVETQALAEVCDASTEEGRKRIWNIKNQVVAVEKVIDEFGKKIQADAKAVVDQTNKIRKGYRDHLQSIKDAVMKPRVEWEEKEAARQEKHRKAIEEMQELMVFPVFAENKEALKFVSERRAYFNATVDSPDEKFEEFEAKAHEVFREVAKFLDESEQALIKQIAQDEELEQLRKEKAEREKREREEALRKEGEERARKQAEEEANAKAIADAAAKQAEEEAAKAIKEDPPPSTQEASQGTVKQAIENGEYDDKARKAKVHSAALNALMQVKNAGNLPLFDHEDEAKCIIRAIVRGNVSHVTINY
jgi:hypothetical protein